MPIDGIVELRLATAFDAHYGGFATGCSPVSWGSIDEPFVNLTMPAELPTRRRGCARPSRAVADRPATYYAHFRAAQSLPGRENSEGKRRNAAENRAAQKTPPRGGLLELSE